MHNLQPTKPKSRLRGCLRIIGWIVGIFILLVIVVAFVSPSTGSNSSATQKQPLSLPTQSTSSNQAVPATSSDTPTDAPTDTPVPPPDPNRGIQFSQPVIFGNSMIQAAEVLATNTTNEVKSFTVKATYKNGDTILTTAIGTVNDLLPGQTRTVSLLSQNPLPTEAETVRVDVDTMLIESDTTSGATAASRLVFGKPTISGSGSLAMIDVEVTNNDTNPHSFLVQAFALVGGKLVGVASGAVNDLAPGQVKTASLLSQGKFEGAEINIAAEAVLE